jgi:hypothetical protein
LNDNILGFRYVGNNRAWNMHLIPKKGALCLTSEFQLVIYDKMDPNNPNMIDYHPIDESPVSCSLP